MWLCVRVCMCGCFVHMSDTVSHSLEIAAEIKESNKKVHEEKINLM